MNLNNKVALITGAGAGLGKGLALAFADAGARVVVAEWDAESGAATAAAIEQAGGEALAAVCDVSNAQDVERTVAAAIERFGRIDALVNNAVRHFHAGILETSEEDWDRTVAVGMKGVFLTCRAIIPHMIRQGGGSIINIGSTNQITPNIATAAYTATKGGACALTQQLAVEFGPHNIRCNTISPAGFLTERIVELIPAKMLENSRRSYPLMRVGKVEEIAQTAVFLASDAASFITGINLPVDGGITSMSVSSIIEPLYQRAWGRPVDQAHLDPEWKDFDVAANRNPEQK